MSWRDESFLPGGAGATRLAVAQGTHTGIVSGEEGGNAITAINLPSTSGVAVPSVTDWVTCGIGNGFAEGEDPHTVTAYQSPNTGDAMALLGNVGASTLVLVDLTKMLNATIVPRTSGTSGGHGCSAGTLPSTVVRFTSGRAAQSGRSGGCTTSTCGPAAPASPDASRARPPGAAGPAPRTL